MKTIFTTLAITTSVILFAQQSPPSVEWTQNYKINNTYSYNLGLDNDNNFTFFAKDSYFDTESGETIDNIHLVRLNAGGVVSDVTVNIDAEFYYPYKLLATTDNAFITSNENDGSLQKFSATGALVWEKSFGNDFFTNEFIKTSDNNLLTIGVNFDENDFYYLFRKMNNNGTTIWEKKSQKLNGMYFEPTAITQTNDGGYIVAGVYGDNLEAEYMLGTNLVKLNANGDVNWEKRIAVPANSEVWPQKILLSNDGGFVILSEFDDDSGTTNYNCQYAKYDSNGNVLWSKVTTDYISSIQKSLDNGYVLSTIEENTDPSLNTFELRKIDESGNFVWKKNFGALGNSSSDSLVRTSDGFASLTNFYNDLGTSVKITKFGVPIAATSDIAKQSITLYPNPTVDFLNLKIDNVKSIEQIDFYDVSGRLVKSILDSIAININVKDLKKGSYIVKVKAGDRHLVSKFIKN
ncbi:T9SS type A sorting domain-containing protein [Epilithonimonas xixisoli]|uniref:Putative secreted protein (Por secretion system target) n=1 Tax=Epilithonimonas xixisoli TaxID=1476462 RepID=A0A4R8I4F6_9FLAO|nr:T9SS type A sorting domain-containing protein [Epilithonimonas xixisoli]TDX83153.1 putative secreted protein (Por secretion system target) [Epilithonimonas xixisoli]